MKRATLLGLILLSVSMNVMAADQCPGGSEKTGVEQKSEKDDAAKKNQFEKKD